MSQEIKLQNNNQLNVLSNNAKTFVWDNRYDSAVYTNSGYDDVTLLHGTLLGKVSATGKVKPLASGASDGSQYPIGILKDDIIVKAGASATLTFCVSGDVVESQIVLAGSDTMDTVISDRSIRDRIGADTVGIKLVGSDELTAADNE